MTRFTRGRRTRRRPSYNLHASVRVGFGGLRCSRHFFCPPTHEEFHTLGRSGGCREGKAPET